MSKKEEILSKLFAMQRFGIKPGLDRTQFLLDYLGKPHKKFPSVHIAGTNGKGSTASMLASIFTEAGYKTGLYTSPHINDFNERIRINGAKCSDDFIVEIAEKLLPIAEKKGCTFFEITTAMAFQYFGCENADIAVIETGMGGRFDSTNVVNPLLSIITNIALDHSEYLGSTLEEIAFEKAGIIKNNTPVITAESNFAALKIIEEQASFRKANLLKLQDLVSIENIEFSNNFTMKFDIYTHKDKFLNVNIPLVGMHQAENAGMAILASESISERFNISKAQIISGFAKIKKNTGLQGRIELLQANPQVIIDVAHNPAAVSQLVETLKYCLWDGNSFNVIFGAMADKDYFGMLKLLKPYCNELLLVRPNTSRAESIEMLAEAALKLEIRNINPIGTIQDSLKYALKERKPVLILGSFYVIEEALLFLFE